jgi:hypothetical protein
MPELDPANHALQNETAITHIVQALKGIRYGAVEIVIHEGRVVQIERKEKVRLDSQNGHRVRL